MTAICVYKYQLYAYANDSHMPVQMTVICQLYAYINAYVNCSHMPV